MQGLRPLVVRRHRLVPKQASASRWRRACHGLSEEGIDDLALSVAAVGHDVLIRDGSRYHGAVAVAQRDVLSGAMHVNMAIAFETHQNDEAVALSYVAVHGMVDVEHAYVEVRTAHNGVGLSLMILVL